MTPFALALSVILLASCTKADSKSTSTKPESTLLSCADVDIGRSEGAELTLANGLATRYCFETDDKLKVPPLKLRLFKKSSSGIPEVIATQSLRLSGHPEKGHAHRILLRSTSLLYPVGSMDKPLTGLGVHLEASTLRADLTLANGQVVSLNADANENSNLEEYGLEGARQFDGDSDPIRGLADFREYKVVIDLAPFISSAFKGAQKTFAYSAVRTYVERGFRLSILTCTQTKARENFPFSGVEDFTKVFASLAPGNPLGQTTGLVPLYVSPSSGYSDSPGLSHYNNFSLTTNTYPGSPTRRYLYISLNSRFLDPASGFGASGDVDYWAGVVGRLVLQNLGYAGLSEGENRFLLAYQECVQRNGASQ